MYKSPPSPYNFKYHNFKINWAESLGTAWAISFLTFVVFSFAGMIWDIGFNNLEMTGPQYAKIIFYPTGVILGLGHIVPLFEWVYKKLNFRYNFNKEMKEYNEWVHKQNMSKERALSINFIKDIRK